MRKEREEIRNSKRDKPHILPSNDVTTTTWTREQMDVHIAKIKGGHTVQTEEVLTKEKLQDFTNQGLTPKEISEKTGKAASTIHTYKHKWGIKKQQHPDDMEDTDAIKEAEIPSDFHEEKARHLQAEIERWKEENQQLYEMNRELTDRSEQQKKAIDRYETQVGELIDERDALKKENMDMNTQLEERDRLSETDMRLLPDDAYTEYQTLYEQTAALLKMHLPG